VIGRPESPPVAVCLKVSEVRGRSRFPRNLDVCLGCAANNGLCGWRLPFRPAPEGNSSGECRGTVVIDRCLPIKKSQGIRYSICSWKFTTMNRIQLNKWSCYLNNRSAWRDVFLQKARHGFNLRLAQSQEESLSNLP
jgi:hypothetical protein